MNKVIKKYMMAIVAVMLVIGFSAFKVAETVNSVSQTDWYHVGPNDVTSILEVKGIMSAPPLAGEDDDSCATENEGEICAIELKVQSSAPSPIGEPLDNIDNLPGVSKEGSAFSPLN